MSKRLVHISLLLLAIALVAGVGSAAGADEDWSEAEAIVRRIVPPTFLDKDFPITDFGAVADGATDCRAAIARAVEGCAKAGGGRVVIPPGTVFCDGPIHLASNVNLHVSEGATLKFGTDPARYLPVVLTRYEGTMLYGYSPRIYARGATNVAISGRGTIDGNGLETLTRVRKAPPRGGSGNLRQMNADGVPLAERVFGEGRWVRPSMIEPFECTGVLIEDVTLIDSPFWVVHPTFCKNVTVRRIQVNSTNGNNDGCDPDSSSDVLIEDCRFNTRDDCIAIKSGRDRDGWTVARPSENIVVRRCELTSHQGALCIGSEMSGGVRNVFFEDCQVLAATAPVLIKANLDRGGVVEHVRARRITAEQMRNCGLRIETSYPGFRGGTSPPQYRDFVMEDIHVKEAAGYGVFIEGAASAPVKDVTLRRVTVDKARDAGWFLDLADVRLESVTVNGAELPASPPESQGSPTPPGAAPPAAIK